MQDGFDPECEHWDGTCAMAWQFDDGGRADTGRKGSARDCVGRAVAIAAALPYAEVYASIAQGVGAQRATGGCKRSASARNGVHTSRVWFKRYMESLGFKWFPTMQIGSGCTTHLLKGELPMGRLVVSLSRHYTAVIDGVIRDTFNPARTTLYFDNGVTRMSHRCVYGYWLAPA